MIQKQETLEAKIKNYNLSPVNVYSFVMSNQIMVDITKLDDFLKFINDLDSKYVYFKYEYYDLNKLY